MGNAADKRERERERGQEEQNNDAYSIVKDTSIINVLNISHRFDINPQMLTV